MNFLKIQRKERLVQTMGNDMITLSDLESIAKKVNELPRPLDIQAHDVGLNERELRILTAFRTVSQLALFNDFQRVNNRIKSHHHVVLSVEDGIEFRANGFQTKRPDLIKGNNLGGI